MPNTAAVYAPSIFARNPCTGGLREYGHECLKLSMCGPVHKFVAHIATEFGCRGKTSSPENPLKIGVTPSQWDFPINVHDRGPAYIKTSRWGKVSLPMQPP